MTQPPKIDLERGARISALRDAKGLRIGELARRIGVDPKSVNNWQRGLPISPGHLLALADALGVKPRYISHGAEHTRTASGPSDSVRSAVGRLERLLEDHALRTKIQLDGIEAMLAELLLRTGASPAEVVKKAAARIEGQPDATPSAQQPQSKTDQGA